MNVIQLKPQYGLTDEMRAWLMYQPPKMLFYEFCTGFRKEFDLTPEQSGKLLGEWIMSGEWV